MKEVVEKAMQISEDPYSFLAGWKEKTQKKIIGCFPMHLAEELVHAAGMHPAISWRGNELITLAHAHVRPTWCGLTRSLVDDALKAKLPFLDGFIFYDACLQARALPFVIDRNAKPSFLEIIHLAPVVGSRAARDHLLENLRRLQTALEKFSGRKITTEALNESIGIYNRNRALLCRVYDIRRRNPGLLKAREVAAIVHSAMIMPKEESNELLEKLVADLEKQATVPDGKVRVVLSGHLCYMPRPDVLDLIEQAGAVVVDDDLYVGFRYFANEVAERDEPLEAWADRFYQITPPCPQKAGAELDWPGYIVEMARRNNAQGVINLLAKFCPPHAEWYPFIKKALAAANIPELMLQLEHEAVSLSGFATRLRAFVEMIESK